MDETTWNQNPMIEYERLRAEHDDVLERLQAAKLKAKDAVVERVRRDIAEFALTPDILFPNLRADGSPRAKPGRKPRQTAQLG